MSFMSFIEKNVLSEKEIDNENEQRATTKKKRRKTIVACQSYYHQKSPTWKRYATAVTQMRGGGLSLTRLVSIANSIAEPSPQRRQNKTRKITGEFY